MYYSQINTRYAKSLFLLAKEKNIIDEIKKNIELLIQWFGDYPEIQILLEHPVIKPSKKIAIISELLQDKINKYTLLFLKLIIKKKRENHLKSICIDFIDLYKKHQGIKTALITTSIELTLTHKTNINKSIEKAFSSVIELNTKVDESILGGMIIQVEDKQLDLSVANQIKQLRDQFINIDFNIKNNQN